MHQRQSDHRDIYHDVFKDAERCDPDAANSNVQSLSPFLLSSNTADFRSPEHETICQALINEFFETLFGENPIDRRLTPKRAERFLDFALHFLWTLELVLQPHSIELLSLGWITELLCESKINPSTARKYISQLATRTGIHFELSHDVCLWDNDDLETFLAYVDRKIGRGQSTKNARAFLFVRFFKFCGSLGLLESVGIPKVSNGFITTRKRNHLLEPYKINTLVKQCSLQRQDIAHAISTTVMLSYYAGLRHDEVARQRLNHFQTYCSLYSDG